MLKKAGIIVAGSAAALLALSPLAFAGESGHGHHKHGSEQTGNGPDQVNSVNSGSHSSGLIAIGDINALNNLNVCPSTAVGLGIGDVLGILSPGRADVPVGSGDPVCVNDNSLTQKNKD